MSDLKFEQGLNQVRRENARLPGTSGRHTLQMTERSFFDAVRKHGREIATTRAGWDELHEQGRFNGLVTKLAVPGRRNRHGRVTWHKSYAAAQN